MQQPRVRTAFLLAAALTVAVSAQQPRDTAQQPGNPARSPAANTPTQPPQQAPPTFRNGINFVRVDATITDKKGQPVTDLKQADFEVTEDG
jgi:hypothetical protein